VFDAGRYRRRHLKVVPCAVIDKRPTRSCASAPSEQIRWLLFTSLSTPLFASVITYCSTIHHKHPKVFHAVSTCFQASTNLSKAPIQPHSQSTKTGLQYNSFRYGSRVQTQGRDVFGPQEWRKEGSRGGGRRGWKGLAPKGAGQSPCNKRKLHALRCPTSKRCTYSRGTIDMPVARRYVRLKFRLEMPIDMLQPASLSQPAMLRMLPPLTLYQSTRSTSETALFTSRPMKTHSKPIEDS
jgi:hypothetical protein